MIAHDDWAGRLCQHFFIEGRGGVPVALFVDIELLVDLSGESEHAAEESLCIAVQRKLNQPRPGWDRSIFERIRKEAVRWKIRGGQGCPPFLPALAVSVLAATQMERESTISASNYYVRLRRLLDLSGKGEPPGYGEVVPELFRLLAWWLDEVNAGARGFLTVPRDPRPARIGYALSQALFRNSDRALFTVFFAWLGLAPEDDVDGGVLAAYYPGWAARAPGVSSAARTLALEPQYRDYLEQTLGEAFAEWNGQQLDESGRRAGSIHLLLQLIPRPALSLVAECPEGFPHESTFVDSRGDTTTLLSSSPGWYDEDLPVSPDVLRHGVGLIQGRFSLTYDARPVLPMAASSELEGYASVRHATPGDPHWVLFQEGLRDKVLDFLAESGRSAGEPYEVPGLLPSGWRLRRGVVVDAARSVVDAELSSLIPRPKNLPVLRGGLRMPYGRRVYLAGGEPDLHLPPDFAGTGQRVTVGDAELEVPDSRIVPLAAQDEYSDTVELKAGNLSLTFSRIATVGSVVPEAAGILAQEFEGEPGTYQPRSLGPEARTEHAAVAVSGAVVAGRHRPLSTRRPPLLLRTAAAEYVVAGRQPGEIATPHSPQRPGWLARARLQFPFFEFHPEFDPVWVLWRWRRGVPWAEPRVFPSPPVDSGRVPGRVAEWISVFTGEGPKLPEDTAELWEQYRQLAQRVHDELE